MLPTKGAKSLPRCRGSNTVAKCTADKVFPDVAYCKFHHPSRKLTAVITASAPSQIEPFHLAGLNQSLSGEVLANYQPADPYTEELVKYLRSDAHLSRVVQLRLAGDLSEALLLARSSAPPPRRTKEEQRRLEDSVGRTLQQARDRRLPPDESGEANEWAAAAAPLDLLDLLTVRGAVAAETAAARGRPGAAAAAAAAGEEEEGAAPVVARFRLGNYGEERFCADLEAGLAVSVGFR